jgi:acyl-CoA thioesterase-1
MAGVWNMASSVIKNIGIWGDSLLKGIVFDEENGKYRTLKQCSVNLFNKVFPISIKNNSRFGCTAPKALESLERSLAKGFQADVVLLEFGGNDCDYNWAEVSNNPVGEHQPHTPFEEFTSTMKKMVQLLLKHNIRPLLMNLPPIDAERYFSWISQLKGVNGEKVLLWLKQKDIIYRQQERYSLAIEKLAYKEGLPLIDVRDRFLTLRNYRDYLCLDGIHLNESGHKILGEAFSSYAVGYL